MTSPHPLHTYRGGPLARSEFEHGGGPVGVAVSLFSGAGGLDLGVEAAGFDVAVAVERDRDAADALEKNFSELRSEVIRDDILAVDTAMIRKAAGLRHNQRPALLVGGPPCTPFSKSGYWLEWKRAGLDPDASLLQAYTRVLAELQPRAFILENVYSLTFNNQASRPHFDRLLREIDEAGYAARWEVLNAADHGVPQARPRLIIVGVRRKDRLVLPELPAATHTGRWERRTSGKPDGLPHVTAGDALRNLTAEPESEEAVNGQFGQLLPDIPPGDNYLFYTAKRGHPDPKFEWRKRYWSFLLKLSPDKPAPTIQAQPGPYVGPFHWENRRLRVGELKRLFTFPDDYHFVGTRSSIQSQVGNAVPPLLAWKVAREVAAVIGE
jgi:DNA (cytosine-5)-methyltransferase 1